MIWQNIRMATSSLRQHKLRAFLTILGIIIGVSSVVSVFAVGAGLKNSVADQVSSFGTNLLQITPGKLFNTDEEGESTGFNFAAGLGVSTLTEKDIKVTQGVPNVRLAAPITLISAVPTVKNIQASSAMTVATTPDMYEILKQNQQIDQGHFLKTTDGQEVVLGFNTAQKLFPDTTALGRSVRLRGQDFKVVGVMREPAGGFNLGPSVSDMVFIPFATGKDLNNGIANIMEIDAQIEDTTQTEHTKQDIVDALKRAHRGEEDFTVSTPEEQLKLLDQILNAVTGFIAAIAAISLLVGGIGIMNIMLVSVTERTREIGIRKAIGATRGHILVQFLTEAIILCLLGGLLGLGVAYLEGLAIKQVIDITPEFTPAALILAFGVASTVGIMFGIMPALKAARKHPVEALRYE